VGNRTTPDPRKDTLRNITNAREFVVNVVSEEFAEKMNLCSGDYPPEVDEFELSGLTPVASDLVKPPRVAESHINMECRLLYTIQMSSLINGGNLVLGEVVRFHIDDAYVSNYRIDADKLRAIGRMAGSSYTRTKDRFDMIRPA
jgi:flavin reductase (DIM6/NTAB) family NADH-FMN oxidoreductase RutF